VFEFLVCAMFQCMCVKCNLVVNSNIENSDMEYLLT